MFEIVDQYDARYDLPNGSGRQPYLYAVSQEAARRAVFVEYPKAFNLRIVLVRRDVTVARGVNVAR